MCGVGMNNVVLLTVNGHYENQVAVALTSLMRHNPEQRVMLFTTAKNDRLEHLVKLYPTVELLEIVANDTSWFKGASWISDIDTDGMCLRLKAMDVISMDYPDIQRVLYMDSDTITMGNFQDIWDADLTDCFVAGVMDRPSLPNHKQLYQSSADWVRLMMLNRNYFNSGVMLLNMPLITQHFKGKIADGFPLEHDPSWLFPDQDYLNKIFSRDRKTKIMPRRYNYFPEVVIQRKMTMVDLIKNRRGSDNAKIIHFTGHTKPWANELHRIPNEFHLQYRFDLYYAATLYALKMCDNVLPSADFVDSVRCRHEYAKFIPIILGQLP